METPPSIIEQLRTNSIKGKDELNLAEFPIALLTEHVPPGKHELVFEDTFRDPKTGKLHQRQLTVSVSPRYGLPTAKDDEVLLGLIQLTKLDGFQSRSVPFSRAALIQLLGWPDSGQSYRRVGEALDRWAAVYLDYKKAWWDPQARSWVDTKFHVLDNVSLIDQEQRKGAGGQLPLPFSTFTWNEMIFRSFESKWMRGLNFGRWIGLKTATAKRMYRFLGKRFYRGPKWEFDLEEFALVHVGLSRESFTRTTGSGEDAKESIHNGKIKEKLAPAIRELEKCRLLKELPPEQRYKRVGRGRWRVVFIEHPENCEKDKGDKEDGGQPELPVKAVAAAENAGLVAELTSRGVLAKAAAKLAAEYPAEFIAGKVELFDALREAKDGKVTKNPAGWLVNAIRDDYQPPEGFVPKAERERQAQAVAARKQAQAKEKQQARRRQEQEKAAHAAERRHIERLLALLTPEQREALERRALDKATRDERERAAGGSPMAQMQRRILVDQQLLHEHPLPVQSLFESV